jgi:hypothetical protein
MEGKVAVLGVLLVVVGFVGGLGAGTFVNVSFPPSSHQNIVNALSVVDLDYSTYLVAECVHSGSSPQLAVTPGKNYDHTVWIWYTLEYGDWEGKDANAAMELWGPLDENEYTGMISKLAGNNLRVFWGTEVVGDLTLLDEAIGFVVYPDGSLVTMD